MGEIQVLKSPCKESKVDAENGITKDNNKKHVQKTGDKYKSSI